VEKTAVMSQLQKRIIPIAGNRSFQGQASGDKFLKEEERFKERKINEFIAKHIGRHYLNKFKEEKVRQKKQLDKLIKGMLASGSGIVISGGVGVGKTMDLVYVVKRIVKGQESYAEKFIPDIPVAYYFMPALFQKLHYGEKARLDKFVVLDDWGREYAEPFALSQFEEMVERVYSKDRTLVVTTNLTKEEFLEREGWLRITDRVREMCAFIEIKGESQRGR
jgi:DNA replication protein DnaC